MELFYSELQHHVFENWDTYSLYISACLFIIPKSPRQSIFLLYTQWPAQQHSVPAGLGAQSEQNNPKDK